MTDYLLDLRLVAVHAGKAAFYASVVLLPLWPGWRLAKQVKKRGANRLPTVAVGGGLSAGLATASLAVEGAFSIAADQAPDVKGLWPVAVVYAAALGLFVLWPGYAFLLHLFLRRRPGELPKLDGP